MSQVNRIGLLMHKILRKTAYLEEQLVHEMPDVLIVEHFASLYAEMQERYGYKRLTDAIEKHLESEWSKKLGTCSVCDTKLDSPEGTICLKCYEEKHRQEEIDLFAERVILTPPM